jgi:hypothetical protein
MGCCGHRRAALTGAPQVVMTRPSPNTPLTASQPPSVRPPAAVGMQPVKASPARASVSLRYIETTPILVRGPATGRNYPFSSSSPVQEVDARDATALLRTRFFRQS